MPFAAHRHVSPLSPAIVRPASKADIAKLHQRCGIYTKPDVVGGILDAVDWTPEQRLFEGRLLEPAAGDGAFLVEAVTRLILSCRAHGITPELKTIRDCIRSFELHEAEATKARRRLFETLRHFDIHQSTARSLTQSWVSCEDFLLSCAPDKSFSHAVGNPPYVRWAKIPDKLKVAYRRRLPREMTGGDLFLPFLDRALEQLEIGGKCGFLCSDRWKFMAFAEGFRQKWLPRLTITSNTSVISNASFVRQVDAYPSILIATCKTPARSNQHGLTGSRPKTLRDLGYEVRVGPALGHTPAFVLEPEEVDVEEHLLRPWVDAAEIREGEIRSRGRKIIAMNDKDGKLIDVKRFPLLAARLKRFKAPLSNRAIVRSGAVWYRPIDRLIADQWDRPKLLIPELAKIPRVALDTSGSIPSHGIYAVFAPDGDIEALFQKLCDGRLARALDGIAPKVKGDFVRCYKRFLDMIILD